jgi:acyl-CoA thioester hydrolase
MGVYFDDLDPFHILHNARYLLLFERTLGSFWRVLGLGGMQDPGSPDRFHLVKTNQIEYLSPVKGEQEVRVRVWIEKLGRSSLTFGFKLMPMDEDRECARGSRTVIRVDAVTLTPTPWTDELRRRLTPWVGAE